MTLIRDKILSNFKRALKRLKINQDILLIEHPERETYGDYASNIALLLARKQKCPPLKIAQEIVKCLPKMRFIKKIEIVKPGFINFFLSEEFFINELNRILKEGNEYGSSKAGKGKVVIIDYSSPNIAKPFGIGHLRSTIIGQALYNIYKFLGFKSIGDNHLGDWGTQFGKLAVAAKKWGIKKFSVNNLEKLYVKFHKETEKNPELEKEARFEFKKLEEGEKEAKNFWKKCVDVSLKEFNRIYQLLGVKIDYAFGESFYQPMLEDIVREAKRKKVLKKSQGALVIKFPRNEFPPAIILKSDGTTTYFTRDLATIKFRLKKWRPNLIIYEVGADQALHFKQLFKAVELLGWAKKEKFFHVAHGLIRTKTGKFSTRKGETIHLEEVLNEAILRAREVIENSETGRGLNDKEKNEIAKMVGIGAVKYNDLKQHPSSDIIFEWEKILNLKGNSGPYLQYTFARCQSVLKKINIKKIEKLNKIKVINSNLEEKNILRTIYRFPEVVEEAAEKFSPNLICNFIFDLAQKYNLFYNLHPIIKAETPELKNFRIVLTFAVSQILKNSLSLLGISIPKKM